MHGKTILVTGGAGFLGSVLCKKLVEQGYYVKILDSFIYKDVHLLGMVKYIKGDVRHLEYLLKAAEGVDAVVHLAAIVGDQACLVNPECSFSTNYFATKSLIDTCKHYGIRKLLFASTCSLYGFSIGSVVQLHENSALNPVSLYAETKMKAEHAVLQSSIDNAVLRLSTLYGLSSRMRFDLVLNLFAAQAVKEKKITIHGGSQWRPFLHVSDAADVFIKFLENSHTGVYNVGNENYRLSEISRIIKELVPEVKVKVVPQDDLRNYNVCFDKLKKDVKPVFKYSVKKGLQEIIENMNMFDFKQPIYNNFEWLKRL